ncbi:MAG: DNA topoisomerase III [Ignavibacteriae bacterium]|nr:DNA topoisomerase III [Ignavibacteriota bacterium]
MKVCIAEKPSVAKEIANILGANSRKDGFYEGNGYQVTWTFGHFCSLNTPDDYQQSWKKWSLQNLPMLPPKFDTKIINDKGVKKQFNIIKNLFDKAELVINCGDAGQEGELIQRWVIKHAGYKGEIKRLWISSLTEESIKNGFKKLEKSNKYDNLYYAGSSRAIGDWLLGMNATRLYTLKYGGYKQVLSIGRVQTPTLAMIVKRFKEIDKFNPTPYWELQTLYKDAIFNCEDGRFEKKENGENLLEQVKEKPITILSITKKKGKEQPPRLFDLTGLQVHCNKKFSYTADKTLKTIQKLYDTKLVTYPRVDTTYLPEDMFPKIPETIKNLQGYENFTKPLLENDIKKTKKVFDNKKITDHHAIIPTGVVPRNLSKDEFNVYDSITRQFLAAFYPECQVANTNVKAEVEGVKFKAKGKEILDEGWRVLFPKTKKTKDDNEDSEVKDDKILPTFEKGESGKHEPSFLEKQTKAPNNYTEASLLRGMESAGKNVDDEELRDLMKANGIGRPSTRAAIIETLFRRNYIKRNKKQILATDTGIQLINTIENELLKSAELTGQWEKKIRDIELGEYSAGKFIKEMKVMVEQLVNEVKAAKAKPKISAIKERKDYKPKKKSSENEIVNSDCPKCKEGKLLKGQTAFGCSRWKENCKFRLPFEYMDKKISEKQLLRLLEKGSTVLLKGFNQDDKKINGILSFDKNFEIKFDKKEEVIKKENNDEFICPKCKKGKVIKGKSAFGCSEWKSGCDFRTAFDSPLGLKIINK